MLYYVFKKGVINMLKEKQEDLKDEYRFKYFNKKNKLKYIILKKIVVASGVTWGAWYRFVYYGENSISLDKIKMIDKGVKNELLNVKKEIEIFLEEC